MSIRSVKNMKKSNNCFFLENKNHYLALFLTSPVVMETAYTLVNIQE